MLALSRTQLETLLREDVPYGDLTTETLGIADVSCEMHFAARDVMIVSAVEEAAALLELAGAVVEVNTRSGDELEARAPILCARGRAGDLLAGWKTAQTLIEASAGISTRTAELVKAAEGVAVACTRKNFPGTKALVAKAIAAGGGQMHRLGLSETLLVTAEHRCLLSPRQREELVSHARSAQPEKRVLFEVSSVEEARLLVGEGATALQLEKMTPPEITSLVAETRQAGRSVTWVAAGGIQLGNIAQYAATGVDVIVTSSPYFAPPRDVQVTFRRAP